MPLSDRLAIDLPELKQYLKIEHDADDDILSRLSSTAVEMIDDALNDNFIRGIDDHGNPIYAPVPLALTLAAWRMVAAWYEHRIGGETAKSVGGVSYVVGDIPPEAMTLLSPYVRLVGL